MPGTVAEHPNGSQLRGNLGGVDRIPSCLWALIEAQCIVNLGSEMRALALDNEQLAITSISNVVEHLQRLGGRLCGRGGDNNREPSGGEDHGADIGHRSHLDGDRNMRPGRSKSKSQTEHKMCAFRKKNIFEPHLLDPSRPPKADSTSVLAAAIPPCCCANRRTTQFEHNKSAYPPKA